MRQIVWLLLLPVGDWSLFPLRFNVNRVRSILIQLICYVYLYRVNSTCKRFISCTCRRNEDFLSILIVVTIYEDVSWTAIYCGIYTNPISTPKRWEHGIILRVIIPVLVTPRETLINIVKFKICGQLNAILKVAILKFILQIGSISRRKEELGYRKIPLQSQRLNLVIHWNARKITRSVINHSNFLFNTISLQIQFVQKYITENTGLLLEHSIVLIAEITVRARATISAIRVETTLACLSIGVEKFTVRSLATASIWASI